MHKRIYYSCKKCGWEASIIEAWSDLKPRRCPKKNCKTNFKKEPDQLSTRLPQDQEIVQEEALEELNKDAGEVLKSEGAPKYGRNEKTALSKRLQTP